MKRRRFVSFFVEQSRELDLLRFADEIGCPEGLQIAEWHLPSFEHIFGEDDPRLEAVQALLKREGLSSMQYWLHSYTDAELQAAPLLHLSVTTAERDIGRHSHDQFDFATGCPACHTGARQVGPLVNRPRGYGNNGLPKKALICGTLEREILVAEPVYEALRAANISGAEFLQAISIRGAPLPWWQILPSHVMPRVAPETKYFARWLTPTQMVPDPGCRVCERDSYFGSMEAPSQLAYRRNQLPNTLPDVAETWEGYGMAAFEVNGYLPRGMVLVSPRVLDVLRRLKIRAVEYEPVRILEDC